MESLYPYIVFLGLLGAIAVPYSIRVVRQRREPGDSE
jgi:hypothetical protein